VALAALIGLFSLRVRTIFFAMITLAVASAFAILASQLPALTGGEDGLNYRLPAALRASFSLADDTLLGVRLNGRLVDYYLVYAAALVLVLVLLRVVNSPFGSVLMAIRENPFRAEAIGYRTVVYRTIASCIAAAVAALAGALLALWSSQTNPDTTLSFDIMVDILLMVVIGGMGTMYGAVLGAVLLVFAQNYLQDVLAIANQALAGVPVLAALFHPDRWLLWLGVAFILCVYFFPTGIVGSLRRQR
jgi:branched-chain amino acid transport system permease protein